MDRKQRLLQRLTEEAYGLGLPNEPIDYSGSAPIGTHLMGHDRVARTRDRLEQFYQLHEMILADLRELLALSNSSPGLNAASPALRVAITAIETTGNSMMPSELQTALNGLHRALGGAGLPYIR